jgi:hypothetical protein
MLGDQLLAVTEIAGEIPLHTLAAGHQQIDEVIHHQRDFSTGERDLAKWAGLPLRDARAALDAIASELDERPAIDRLERRSPTIASRDQHPD